MTRKRKETMVTKSLYLPKPLCERVDRYAELRGLSRNRAFEELLKLAFQDLEEPRTVSEALKEA